MCLNAVRDGLKNYPGIPDLISFCVVYDHYYTATFEDKTVITIFHSDRTETVCGLVKMIVDKYCYQVQEFGLNSK